MQTDRTRIDTALAAMLEELETMADVPGRIAHPALMRWVNRLRLLCAAITALPDEQGQEYTGVLQDIANRLAALEQQLHGLHRNNESHRPIQDLGNRGE